MKKETEKPTEHQNAFIKNYISAKLLLCKPNKYPNHIPVSTMKSLPYVPYKSVTKQQKKI